MVDTAKGIHGVNEESVNGHSSSFGIMELPLQTLQWSQCAPVSVSSFLLVFQQACFFYHTCEPIGEDEGEEFEDCVA